MKKDTRKWCEIYKIAYYNSDECHSKQSLVPNMEASMSKPGFNSNSETKKEKKIIHVEVSVTIPTTKI